MVDWIGLAGRMIVRPAESNQSTVLEVDEGATFHHSSSNHFAESSC